MSKGFLKKEILKTLAKDSFMILLLNSSDDKQEQYYHYIALKTELLQKLQQAISKGDFNFSKYAKIIIEGKGAIPPKQVQDKMLIEYGFDTQIYLSGKV